MVDLGAEWCKMRFVMFGAAFFVGLLCAFAVAGAGGALLSDVSGSGHASSLFSVLSAAGSAVVGFAAVVFPAEWMRFKMVKVGPQAAFPLAMGKFGMTVLLLTAAASGMGDMLAPAAFVFGVVLAAVFGVLRLRNFSAHIAEIRGN